MALSMPAAFHQGLESVSDINAKVQILTSIKNEISGHELRKIDYIRAGLISSLARELRRVEYLAQTLGSEEVETRAGIERFYTQTAHIVRVLAHGGPTFTQPLLSTTIVETILLQLSSCTSPKLTLSLLRCLNAIADHLPLALTKEWTADRRLSQLLYSQEFVGLFSRIVARASASPVSQQACDAALALVCKTCTEPSQKATLVDTNLLTLLCQQLSSFIVADGLVTPTHGLLNAEFGDVRSLPKPAPVSARLAPVLEATSCIVEYSKVFATMFVADPALTDVLGSSADEFSPSDIRRSPSGVSYLSGTAVPRSKTHAPIDALLPFVSDLEKPVTADQFNFPPLGFAMSVPKRRTSSLRTAILDQGVSALREGDEEKGDSAVISWLLYLVRAHRGKTRVVAAKLLVLLQKYELVGPPRIKTFGSLLVPVLVEMTKDHDSSWGEYEAQERSVLLSTGMHHRWAVPAILATMIMNEEMLQRAAVESKLIQHVSSALKANCAWHDVATKSCWYPRQQNYSITDGPDDASLGLGGPSLRARHAMAYREGLLQALAATALLNDGFRKEIYEQGALVQIVTALEPFEGSVATNEKGDSISFTGNSAAALLAACNTVLALARSVSSLRTKLVDHDLATPIIQLMASKDIQIRIAATKVIANLSLDFSPMKKKVVEQQVVGILCRQAHSSNATLRFESIWALKSLVFNSPNLVKQFVIDELGVLWLRDFLATDPHDMTSGAVVGLSADDYATGSLSSQNQGTSSDVRMGGHSDYGNDAGSVPTEYNKHTVEEDTGIQEQLLALVRNLFAGENAIEIVEYVSNEIGLEELIHILVDRLRVRTLVGPTRKDNQAIPPTKDTVIHTLYVVANMAASGSSYRNALAAHHGLMKQIATFCTASEPEIRRACCWVVINMIYEQPNDPGVRQRAIDLNKMGLLTHMRNLGNLDHDLDVKERARTASNEFSKFLP